MPTSFKQSDLQRKYLWTRDKHDTNYTGVKDRIKVDKDEGYEVLPFLNHFLGEHGKVSLASFHAAENALHLEKYSNVQMRDELNIALKKELGW
ncbi:hypothetical protein [Pseudomonas viridiflava]|jgi:hypothetical protein|uniref:hypothetical protein n=2 Tax=Pseudomonas viridiflava TaxID=33069 RepID=UPI000F015178|nr:hypothetical protein [Pseudomonas viridiflava]WKW30846.1 hypothetical protein KIH13_18665 [Pseudomonas viridiflava]